MKLMKFTAVWCSPCTMFAPIVSAVVEETGIEYEEVDIDACPILVEKYNITSVPTIIIEQDGDIIYNNTGVMSKYQLLNTVRQLLQ